MKNFEQRAGTAKTRADAMRRAIAATSSPQPPPPSPDAYHLAVRVTGADQALGFPGVVVEIGDPRDAKATPIASATTDVDGNVTLTVGPELAKEIDKRDATISAFSPSGKLLARLPDGVCVRLNQVETKVLTVKESGETTPLKEAALETRASREMLLESLAARTQSLAKDRSEKLANLDCKLQDVDALVAEIEKPVDLADIVARAKPYEPPPGRGGPSPGSTPPTPGAPPGRDTPRDSSPGGDVPPVGPGRGTPPGDITPSPEPKPPRETPPVPKPKRARTTRAAKVPKAGKKK